MTRQTNPSKTTLKERLLLLEHSLHGNGSKGIVEQIHELDKEIKSIKRLLYTLLATILLLLGQEGIHLIKTLL